MPVPRPAPPTNADVARASTCCPATRYLFHAGLAVSGLGRKGARNEATTTLVRGDCGGRLRRCAAHSRCGSTLPAASPNDGGGDGNQGEADGNQGEADGSQAEARLGPRVRPPPACNRVRVGQVHHNGQPRASPTRKCQSCILNVVAADCAENEAWKNLLVCVCSECADPCGDICTVGPPP